MKKFTALMFVLLFASFSLAGNNNIIKIGSDIEIKEGVTVDNVVAIGGSVSVNGTVLEDLVAVGGSVILGPQATVVGKVVAVGGKVIKSETSLVKDGIVEEKEVDVTTVINTFPGKQIHNVFRILKTIAIIGFLALALLLVSLFPNKIGLISSKIEKHPLASLLWGLLGIVLIIPLAIMLLISIVGIILIPLEILALIIIKFFGVVAVAQLVGKKVAASFKKVNLLIVWETLVGLLVFWLISWIPVLGILLIAVAAIIGFGAVISSLLDLRKA